MAAVGTKPHGRPELKRELGLGMTTAMVVGNMIGSGVFLLPASLAGRHFLKRERGTVRSVSLPSFDRAFATRDMPPSRSEAITASHSG